MNEKIEKNLKILQELTQIITYICKEEKPYENKYDTRERPRRRKPNSEQKGIRRNL